MKNINEKEFEKMITDYTEELYKQEGFRICSITPRWIDINEDEKIVYSLDIKYFRTTKMAGDL